MEYIIKPDFPELQLEEKVADAINVLRDQPAAEVTQQMQRQEIYDMIMHDVHVTTQKLLEVADTLISNAGVQNINASNQTERGKIYVGISGSCSSMDVETEGRGLRLSRSLDGGMIRIFPRKAKIKIRESYLPWHQYISHPLDQYERDYSDRFVDIVPELDKLAREYAFSKRDSEKEIKPIFEAYHLLPQLIVTAFCKGLLQHNEQEAKRIRGSSDEIKRLLQVGEVD